jgi:NTP pyrophosphatase (non-canonical NTP hydrolase)
MVKDKELTFKEAIKLAEDVIDRFEKVEGRKWGIEGAIIELQKQTGELAKYVMMAEKYYPKGFHKDHKYAHDTVEENIGDELADILYATIRIAKHYKINLEEAHLRARKGEDDYLKSKGI